MPDPNVIYIGQNPSQDCICGHTRQGHSASYGLCAQPDCGCGEYQRRLTAEELEAVREDGWPAVAAIIGGDDV